MKKKTMSSSSLASVPKNAVIKDPEKPDALNLIEVPGFPCQQTDFSDLVFSIDEMSKFEDHFYFSDVLELSIEKDEVIDCFIEGMCYFEEELKNMFLILTTKQLLIYNIVTEKTVKLFKSINLKELETIFYHKREVSLIGENNNHLIEKFDLKVGFDEELKIDGVNVRNTTYNNRHFSEIKGLISTAGQNKTQVDANGNKIDNNGNIINEEDHKNFKNKKMREYNYQIKAFYFCVSIWRVYFMLTDNFLLLLKMSNQDYLANIDWEPGYLERIYRKIFELRLENLNSLYVKIEENRKIQLEAKKLQEAYFGKVEDEFNFKEKINANFDGICFGMFEDIDKSIEFTNANLKYSKFFVKFHRNYMILFDFINDKICFVELKLIESIIINNNRFVILIYLYPNENLKMKVKKNEREKIILFHNNPNDREYTYFRTIVIQFLEYQRLCKYEYEINYFGTEKIYNTIRTDRLNYYSFQKNNVYVKSYEAKNVVLNLSKYDSVKVSQKDCCCKKKFTNQKKEDQFAMISGMNSKESKCLIY